LWRLGPEPILCFDGDAAGQRAAERALRRALPLLRPGHSLRFAALPAGEDPDSLIRRTGRESFDEIVAAARPLSRMLWDTELGAGPVDTPERRADLDRRLTEDVALINDPTVRNEYRRFVRQRLFETSRPPWGRRGMAPRPAFARERPASGSLRAADRVQREILFRILLNAPWLIEEVAEQFAALDMPEAELDKLRREILEIDALRPGLDASALRQHLLLNGFAATVDALFSPSVDSGFLIRRSASGDARREWAHVIGMLVGGEQSALTEASNRLLDDVSTVSWERFLSARERALRQDGCDDDPI
jgi:DNA primase